MEVGTDSREMTSATMGTAWSGEHQPGSGSGDRQSRDDNSQGRDSMVRGASARQWMWGDSREMTSGIMGTAWSGEHQPGSGCGETVER